MYFFYLYTLLYIWKERENYLGTSIENLFLQNLTGGTLLSRDREFIVFYRGKDFLPRAVSSAIEARKNYGRHGEKQSIGFSGLATNSEGSELGTSELSSQKEHDLTDYQKTNSLSEQRAPRYPEAVVRRTSIKLSMVCFQYDLLNAFLFDLYFFLHMRCICTTGTREERKGRETSS